MPKKNIESNDKIQVQPIPSELATQLTICRGTMNRSAGKYRQSIDSKKSEAEAAKLHAEGQVAFDFLVADVQRLGNMMGFRWPVLV